MTETPTEPSTRHSPAPSAAIPASTPPRLSGAGCPGSGLLPGYLQDGHDVHGSHPLFYWLRARGSGLAVSRGHAGVVLTWRPDAGRLAALRPVGDAGAAAGLLDTVLAQVAAVLPGIPLVARYCGDALAPVQLGRGWHNFGGSWCAQAPLDDEAFPEVVITADPPRTSRRAPGANRCGKPSPGTRAPTASAPPPVPSGARQRLSRMTRPGAAVSRRPASTRRSSPPSASAGTTASPTTTCTRRRTGGLGDSRQHHRDLPRLLPVDGKVPSLATYFLWQVYLHERRNGAAALNLGGSETRSLFGYKARTFPDTRSSEAPSSAHPLRDTREVPMTCITFRIHNPDVRCPSGSARACSPLTRKTSSSMQVSRYRPVACPRRGNRPQRRGGRTRRRTVQLPRPEDLPGGIPRPVHPRPAQDRPAAPYHAAARLPSGQHRPHCSGPPHRPAQLQHSDHPPGSGDSTIWHTDYRPHVSPPPRLGAFPR